MEAKEGRKDKREGQKRIKNIREGWKKERD